MFSTLKPALVVAAVASIATAGPILSLAPKATPAAYPGSSLPVPTYVTSTRQVTVVIQNVPIDCVHSTLPTQAPKANCDLDNPFVPVTSIRQYCAGSVDFPPWNSHVNASDGEDADDAVDVDDAVDAEDADDADDLDDDDDDSDDEDDDDSYEQLEERSDPDPFADCTSPLMMGPTYGVERVSTAFTTTSTITRTVNCGKCAHVTSVPFYSPGIAPVTNFTSTLTAYWASTSTVLECMPSPTLKSELVERGLNLNNAIPPTKTHLTKIDPWPPAVTSYTDFPRGVSTVDCAVYYNLFPSRLGNVRKIYTATATTTAFKDCGDCALVWGTAAYPFQVGPLPTTRTKKGKTTVTAMACRTPGM
ncbi:hypothetical protein V8C35DRAFT_276882 [Trichoderma chlorosporum]